MWNPSSAAAGSYLLIPAGGRGLRMGGDTPKQFRDWGGRPLLWATLEAFLKPDMPPLAGIALAVPPDRLAEVKAWSLGVPLWATVGGATRQASVAAALALLEDQPEAPVLIHDAVRPFPPSAPIQQALEALRHCDGALLAEPSTDTLKRVDGEGRVVGTEPREAIFRAQTPQIALLSTWRKAFDWAEATGFQGTDDVSILEAQGLQVRVVSAPSSNVKLTTPEDWTRYGPL
ncbi:MAG: 2-C-methyl-D-erythritol 4-phosphate cytidylyltransferase [Firmicutes bacterium]|nr:2-C-methyl-D-erythritol 4-phosphate cytidylyltransferase [Bacillota bacterium]